MRASARQPFVIGTVVSLLVAIAGFWGYQTGFSAGLETARLSRTTATMTDGAIEFVADFHLRTPRDRLAFNLQKEAIRTALVEHMRLKSKYMVQSGPGRDGLATQFTTVANRIAGRPIARRVTFDEFAMD